MEQNLCLQSRISLDSQQLCLSTLSSKLLPKLSTTSSFLSIPYRIFYPPILPIHSRISISHPSFCIKIAHSSFSPESARAVHKTRIAGCSFPRASLVQMLQYRYRGSGKPEWHDCTNMRTDNTLCTGLLKQMNISIVMDNNCFFSSAF